MTSEKLIFPKTESWKIFNLISRRYDVLNRILSFGMDVQWRKSLISKIPTKPNLKLLDLATGTADVVITLTQECPQISHAIGLDMAEAMLNIGQQKIDLRQLTNRITLQKGDAQYLPFMDQSFDCLTIAFGIRNIPDLRKVLLEMYRVIANGGRVLILEFSIPQNCILRWGDLMYLRFFVPLIGFLFSGNYRAYKYLNQTIEQFPYGDRFCKILQQMGFQNVKAYPLLGGVATIYVGDKGNGFK